MKRILSLLMLCTFGITGLMAKSLPPTTFRMDQSQFEQLVEEIQQALEAGAQFNLSDLLGTSNPTSSFLGSGGRILSKGPAKLRTAINAVPEALATFISSIKFTDDAMLEVNNEQQVIIIRAALDVPYTHGNEKLYGTIMLSSNLQLYKHASAVTLKPMKHSALANKKLLEAIAKLAENLHVAIALELQDSFKPSQFVEAIARMPHVSAEAKRSLTDIEKVLKVFDDVLMGNITLALTDESYVDPRYGQLYAEGLNIVGTVNIGAPFTNAFTKKLLSTIGSAPSFAKGISANVFIPKSILGTILRVSLPGEIIFGIPGTKTKLAQISRFQIASRIGGDKGLSEGFLEADVTGSLSFYPPWQKEAVEGSVTFSMDSSTNIGIKSSFGGLSIPGLPAQLNNAFFSAKINAARFFKFMIDLIVYIAESAGEQGTALETAGATEVLEAAETVEIVEETTSLIMPFSELGVGGITTLMGRTVEAEICFEYDATNNNINFGIMAQLAKGTANDFIGIKDMYRLFVELQNHYLALIKKSATLIHMQPSAELAQGILAANGALSQEILQYFPDFNLKTATLYIAFKTMKCNTRTMKSGIEIAGSGMYLGQSISADLILNIFAFIAAMQSIIGDVVDLASPTASIEEAAELPDQIEKEASSMGSRLSSMLSSIPGKVGGKLMPGGKSSTSSGGSTGVASTLFSTAAKGISTLMDMGILAKLQYGKINIGPLHITNSEDTDGPRMLLKLGYVMPSVSVTTSKQDLEKNMPFLAGVMDGKINLNIPPGFEADVMGTLGLSGINLISHGKMGNFNALVSGGININPLKNNLTIDIVGGWDEILKAVNDGFANVAKMLQSTISSASRTLGEKIDVITHAMQVLRDRINSAQTIIDRYNRDLAECAAGNPVTEGLNAIRQKAQSAVQETITATGLWKIVDGLVASTNFDYDAATMQKIKNAIAHNARIPGNPLSWVPGL